MTAARALIAEDEPLLAASLAADLRRAWPALEIVAQAGDGLCAAEQALALKPDVCFLDIRMPGCSGLEVAHTLAEEWPHEADFPLIVFVTAYDQYALQAFEARAVDYLVKPHDAVRLAACVGRLQERLAARPAPQAGLQQALDQLRGLLAGAPGGASPAEPRLEVIQAQVGNTVHFVPVDSVVYVEAADKYLRVMTADKEHLIRMPLKDLAARLDPELFWQIHRGTLVQARCISSARRDDSGKVYVSLRGRPEVLVASRLYAHLFKGM